MSRRKERDAARAYEETHARLMREKQLRGELPPENERKKDDDENGNGD